MKRYINRENYVLSDQVFNCNICKSLALKPVITPCGHLFCWECFYISSQNSREINCQVCDCELYLNEIVSLKVTQKKEKGKVIELNDNKIPLRPKNSMKIMNRRRVTNSSTLGLSKNQIVINCVISKNMIILIVILLIVIFLLILGKLNFDLKN